MKVLQFDFFNVDFQSFILIAINVALVIAITVLIDQVTLRTIEILSKRKDLDRRASRQVKTFIRYIIFTIAALAIIAAVGIDLTVVIAGAGVLGIAIGFAAKDILSNFLSGTFLIFDINFSVNDIIKVEDTYGIVRIITLRTTQIKTFDDNIVTVPNANIANSTIINMTSGSKFMLTSIVVRIGYAEDLNKVMNLMKDSLPEDSRIHIDKDSDLRFEIQDIGDRFQGHKVIMYFKVEAHQEPWIRSEVQSKVIKALADEKIEFHREAPR